MENYNDSTAREVAVLQETLATVKSQLTQALAWKDAVIDACVVSWVEPSDDPRDTINRLCWWEGEMALDPLISGGAVALQVKTLMEVAKQLPEPAKLQLRQIAQGMLSPKPVALMEDF